MPEKTVWLERIKRLCVKYITDCPIAKTITGDHIKRLVLGRLSRPVVVKQSVPKIIQMTQ